MPQSDSLWGLYWKIAEHSNSLFCLITLKNERVAPLIGDYEEKSVNKNLL